MLVRIIEDFIKEDGMKYISTSGTLFRTLVFHMYDLIEFFICSGELEPITRRTKLNNVLNYIIINYLNMPITVHT
jgi:hypothetical protein